ncbi:MAG TPA: GNAT family N-acetyltransferase [Solirubrobacteraceae bacterium]|nr:GNAT family N-acetyltransferase [Solirubrobacteraceae bacterium]
MLLEVEPRAWDDLLRSRGVTDVYFSRGYVESAAVLGGGAPVFLHLPGAHGDALFPCLLRDDPPDVVTPYGYGGPLLLGDLPAARFADAYREWCAARDVVTSFVVFHPLAANHAHAEACGFRAVPLAGTVAWGLGEPDLAAGMHRHHRRLVRRAREDGFAAAVDERPADLTEFAALYEATMRRVDASPFYFFGPAYWEALLREVPLVRVDVRGADGAPVAGVLGMGKPPWLHYHLGGAADAGRGTGASHLALLALAEWGRDHGYAVLHLGGGVGGRADALFEYKLRFAPDGRRAAALGKAVHDSAAYGRLTGSPAVDWDGFFPAYRAPR